MATEKVSRPKCSCAGLKHSMDGDGILTLQIDTRKSVGLTKAGTSLLVATTRGWCHQYDELALSLNLIRMGKSKKMKRVVGDLLPTPEEGSPAEDSTDEPEEDQ